MNPEDLQKLAKSTDPENLGAALEQKKEEKVQEMSARDKAAAQIAERRKQKAAQKVGIRTYRDYAADELKKGGGTLTKMIVQEREKEREQKRHSVKNTKNIAISLLALIFVIAGIGIVALSFILVSQQQEDRLIKNRFLVAPQPLVQIDFSKELYIPVPTRSKIDRAVAKDIDETAIPVGDIKHVYLVQDGVNQPKELISSTSLLRTIEAKAPGSLTRALDPLFMYGTYSSVDVSPFVIFTTSSYSTAYAGMLEWEKDLMRDLEPLFNQDLRNVTSSFQDVVLENIDVRAVLDERGEIIFGYGFLQNKQTLVIFNNKLALREIIMRNQRNTIKQ